MKHSKVQRPVHLPDDAVALIAQGDQARVEALADEADRPSALALLTERVADVDATAGNQVRVADGQREAQLV